MSVVVITGCSTGIGRATALHLARDGHRVYATMRSPDADGGPLVQAAADEELDIRLLALDVTDDDSVATAVDAVLADSGHIDVLVNNAGIGWLGTVEETPLQWARDIFEVNYFGVVRMLQAVVPHMRQRRSGTVVNISSVAGRLASAVQGHYCASKWALEALSEALAQEMIAFDVRVAVVEPGFTSTPILEKALEVPQGSEAGPYSDAVRRRIQLFRDAQQIADEPEDVAATVARALAESEQFRYLAGETAAPPLEARSRISDQEWIATGREMTDEEYGAEMERIFGG